MRSVSIALILNRLIRHAAAECPDMAVAAFAVFRFITLLRPSTLTGAPPMMVDPPDRSQVPNPFCARLFAFLRLRKRLRFERCDIVVISPHHALLESPTLRSFYQSVIINRGFHDCCRDNSRVE